MDMKFLHETLEHDLSKITNKRIAILGCGAIGANLAISLARRGFNQFFLFDFDKITEHNISTQPWARQDIGRSKIRTLNAMLWTISEAQTYECFKKINKVSDITNALITGWRVDVDLFIDCFDNREAREYAYDLKDIASVLHIGISNKNTGEVTWDEKYVLPKAIKLDDPCNYPMSRTIVDLTTVAASEAVMEFLLSNKKQNYFVNANTLKIEKL